MTNRSQPAGEASGPPALPWTVAAVIAFAAVLAFASSFRGQFVLDDIQDIANNPHIRRLWPPFEAMFHGHKLPARALPYLTFAIDYQLWGTDPFGYHLTNLAIHIIAAVALFDLSLVTLSSPRVSDRIGRFATPLAAGIAVLWAVHPLQTQSVTYIYQRIESRNGMFCLVSLAAFARSAFGGWRPLPLAISFASCAAAMLCKENAVMLPILLCSYDWCFVARDRRDLASRWRWYAGLAATWGLLAAQVLSQANAYGEFSEQTLTPIGYALSQPASILRYLRLTFWPIGLQILRDAGNTPALGQVDRWLPQAALLAATFAVGVAGCWRQQPWGWLVIAFFVALAPTSSFLPVRSPYGEQRMYLPLAAVLAAVLLGLTTLLQRIAPQQTDEDRRFWPWLMAAATLLWAFFLGRLTAERNALYHDRTTLWASHLDTDPDNSHPHNHLAQLAALRGDPDAAFVHARKAVAGNPQLDALGYLAATFLRMGDEPRADAAMKEGLTMLRGLLPPESRTILLAQEAQANMLHDRQRHGEAEAICAAQLDAMDRVLGRGHMATIEARTILSAGALRRGEFDEAERIGRLNLKNALQGLGAGDLQTQEAAIPLVKTLHASGRGPEAEQVLRDLIDRAADGAWHRLPNLTPAWRTLAGLLEFEGRHGEAVTYREQLLAAAVDDWGTADPRTIRAAVQRDLCVAAAALSRGDRTTAARAARAGLNLAGTELGLADPLAQSAACSLATIVAGSDPAAAVELLRTHIDDMRAEQRSDAATDPDSTVVEQAIAGLLEQSGRIQEALAARRGILRQLLKSRGPDDPATQQAAVIVQRLLAQKPPLPGNVAEPTGTTAP